MYIYNLKNKNIWSKKNVKKYENFFFVVCK